jgi:hypothetical protein
LPRGLGYTVNFIIQPYTRGLGPAKGVLWPR